MHDLKNGGSLEAITGKWRNGTTTMLLALFLMGVVFYLSAYGLGAHYAPSAVPVHHDDYSNYGSGGNVWNWMWIRPFSTLLIQGLAQMGPEWLIWSIRLLSVVFVLLNWKLLCEVIRPANYWIALLLFAVACFATPVIAEYARYTGMVTHMLSGCFGMAAAWALLREVTRPGRGALQWSLLLLVLSVLAKEDFVVLYAVTAAYAVLQARGQRKRMIAWSGIALVISGLLIAGAKFMAASSFLGMSDTAAPYFIDATPTGIAHTIWRYLLGGGHPALGQHGRTICTVFVFVLVSTLVLILRTRAVPKTAYLLAAMLSVMLPYSVLPNHVNAYYELIWLPLLMAACYAALFELVQAFTSASERSAKVFATSIFLLLVTLVSLLDRNGRDSIVSWYDEVGMSNRHVLAALASQKDQINHVGKVCVSGADTFSPWYMHGGSYLDHVMGLHATWYVLADPVSPVYAGLVSGAASSAGKTIVVETTLGMPVDCVTVHLEALK